MKNTLGKAELAKIRDYLDQLGLTKAELVELFQVANTLSREYSVRAILTDPARSSAQRVSIATGWFEDKLSANALKAVIYQVALPLGSGGELARLLRSETIRQVLRLAKSTGVLTRVREELVAFGRIISNDRELLLAIDSNSVSSEAKSDLISKLLADQVHELSLLLATQALSHQGRYVATLAEILDIANELNARKLAKIYVAKPITESQRERLSHELNRIYLGELELEIQVMPKILGGMRIEVADDVIDGSLLARLTNANQVLRA